MQSFGQRWLIVYSGILTAAFAVTVFAGFAKTPDTKFDEITVQRINIVEPDGTLRMTLSNHDKFPGLIIRGKEQPFKRPQAGMLFFNDEGTENGGLIFGGRRNEKGEVVDAGGSLTFDRFDANQEVQLMGVYDKEDRIAGLIVSDSPPNADSHRRLFVGRGDDGASSVALMDANGKKRLVLQVTVDGTPSVSFLDAEGKVVRRMLPTDAP